MVIKLIEKIAELEGHIEQLEKDQKIISESSFINSKTINSHWKKIWKHFDEVFGGAKASKPSKK